MLTRSRGRFDKNVITSSDLLIWSTMYIRLHMYSGYKYLRKWIDSNLEICNNIRFEICRPAKYIKISPELKYYTKLSDCSHVNNYSWRICKMSIDMKIW